MKKKKEKIFVWIEAIQSICVFLLTLIRVFEGFACSVQDIWAKRQKITSIKFLMTPIAIIEIIVRTCKYFLSLKSDVEEYLPKLYEIVKGKNEKQDRRSNKKRKTARAKEPNGIINGGVKSKSGSKKCSTAAAGIGAGLASALVVKRCRNNK